MHVGNPEVGAQSIYRALDILDVITMAPSGLSVAELAERTQIRQSTLYRLVAVLQTRGYIYRISGRLYPGPVIDLGNYTFETSIGRVLRESAAPIARELAASTGANVPVSVYLGTRGLLLLLDQSTGKQFTAIRPSQLFPTTVGAVGKILLAYSKPAVQDFTLRDSRSSQPPVPEPPEQPLTYEELATARRRKLTASDSQVQKDTMGAFAPILQGSRALGSVGAILTKERAQDANWDSIAYKTQAAALAIAEKWISTPKTADSR